MKTDQAMDARSERILELLSRGSSSRDLAEKLGYQEGTMRVYLHHLYRKIGVANKTEAVIWYMRRAQAAAGSAAEATAAPVSDDVFGEMALREGLYTAMGVMSAFMGPFSRVWEVGQRIAGNEPDADVVLRQERVRVLWKSLLQGNWHAGKLAYDAGEGDELLVTAASDAVLLAALLILGGYSGAAQRLQSGLAQRKRTGSVTVREASMLSALQSALDGEAEGLAELHALSTEKAGVRQVAMVLLYHAYVACKDLERARKTANAIWAEAEAAKQQLIAMGERPFATPRSVPAPEKAPARRSTAREKALAR
jgi:DNA-binding CsgD family transcriptional regulator